jgi:uncharacterized phage protein gp47/JayE
MVAQLRLLDPAISAEVGTPERKILDTVAQALADSQIDLTALQGALDLDSKFGGNLDRFIALFGFARQRGSNAEGFVEFGRFTPSTNDIVIPANSRVQGVANGILVVYATTFNATLAAGQTSVLAPVRAVTPGSSGNVAANTINTVVGTPINGITTVNNPQPITNGSDAEGDDELKVRFKNTIFRNLAGTEDQYLALAAATSFSTKANVVGPISRYREYIQVPQVDDATAYDITGDSVLEGGNGSTGEYTSALSSIPYSKFTYDNVPLFVSNGQTGVNSVFYRRDIDYTVNLDPTSKFRGDTFRLFTASSAPNPLDDESTTYQPNITFTNVYTGTNADITAIRPNDVVLFEHSYLSTASRNDLDRNITNCVDVYIAGGNNLLASTLLPAPTTANLFVDNPQSKFHFENFRRDGEPETRPQIGNILVPLMNQPVTGLPDVINVDANGTLYTFEKDLHYWLVEDYTEIGSSIRSRAGIEWNTDLPSTTDENFPLYITDTLISSIDVDGYTYDRSVVDLQASLESSRQITTDVLAHKARRRYFKLDVTVMYAPGSSIADTNTTIAASVQSFFDSQFFGSTIQLSDLLQVIHNVPQVDNVRWTSDVPGSGDRYRLQETDRFGRPLVNVNVRRRQQGGIRSNAPAGLPEIQEMVFSGNPTGGNFAFYYNGAYSAALPYNVTAGQVFTALTSNPILAPVASVTGAGVPADPFIITFTGVDAYPVIQATGTPQLIADVGLTPLVNGHRNLYSEENVLDTDFFLKDDELPSLATQLDDLLPGAVADTVPGMIIRPRAQNTWSR